MSDVIQTLNQFQADYMVLYQKLRAYHWLVRGPLFFQLHPKFEAMYTATALTVDELAERSLTLGGTPHATLAAALGASRVKEPGTMPDAKGMVRDVLQDLEHLGGWLRAAVEQAGSAEDMATANLLEGLADGQEKEAWMLRAFLEE